VGLPKASGGYVRFTGIFPGHNGYWWMAAVEDSSLRAVGRRVNVCSLTRQKRAPSRTPPDGCADCTPAETVCQGSSTQRSNISPAFVELAGPSHSLRSGQALLRSVGTMSLDSKFKKHSQRQTQVPPLRSAARYFGRDDNRVFGKADLASLGGG
jgi:hypothetical protein